MAFSASMKERNPVQNELFGGTDVYVYIHVPLHYNHIYILMYFYDLIIVHIRLEHLSVILLLYIWESYDILIDVSLWSHLLCILESYNLILIARSLWSYYCICLGLFVAPPAEMQRRISNAEVSVVQSTFHLKCWFLKNGRITFFLVWNEVSLGRYQGTVKIWIWLNGPKVILRGRKGKLWQYSQKLINNFFSILIVFYVDVFVG